MTTFLVNEIGALIIYKMINRDEQFGFYEIMDYNACRKYMHYKNWYCYALNFCLVLMPL